MLKKILIGLVIVIGAFAAYVAMQPSDYRIERSATIDASPGQVFAQVNDFHNWQKWSPWADLDPDARAEFQGPDSGEGAKFSWDGNSEVGKGSMTVVGSKPDERIDIRLDFIEPMAGTSDVRFTFRPNGGKTDVTWTMSGQAGFFEKAICMLFFDQDKIIGGMFEKGLKNLEAATRIAARQ